MENVFEKAKLIVIRLVNGWKTRWAGRKAGRQSGSKEGRKSHFACNFVQFELCSASQTCGELPRVSFVLVIGGKGSRRPERSARRRGSFGVQGTDGTTTSDLRLEWHGAEPDEWIEASFCGFVHCGKHFVWRSVRKAEYSFAFASFE